MTRTLSIIDYPLVFDIVVMSDNIRESIKGDLMDSKFTWDVMKILLTQWDGKYDVAFELGDVFQSAMMRWRHTRKAIRDL